MKKKKKNRRRKSHNVKKKKRINRGKLIILILVIIIIVCFVLGYLYHNMKVKEEKYNILNDILKHYSKYVLVTDNTKLYSKEDLDYNEVGSISKGEELVLKENVELTYKDKYFLITSFDKDYYIYYKDVKVIDSLSEYSKRYEKYIPFNYNIKTGDVTNFYSDEDKLIYSFNRSFDFEIIVKKDDKYGVIYQDRLLYIHKDDVVDEYESKNTSLVNTSGIAVLNYHFFYDDSDPGDTCNQIICMSVSNLKKHLNYIKNNDYFTPTMKELEMYVSGELLLPKSVVLTIDDGWRASIGSKVISEYGLNATIFLMSKYYDPWNYEDEYIEVHSHGHDLHNGGECPGGQGGAIKCLDKSVLLEDLSASREKLNNTTYFCYPFYEYNDYSISVLKEAGFTMAFGGYFEGGRYKVVPGANKFKLPRYVIYSYTDAYTIASYLK